MAHSDSEDETIDGLFEATDAEGEEDNEIDEDLLGALENGVEDASEVDEVGRSQSGVMLFIELTGLPDGRVG